MKRPIAGSRSMTLWRYESRSGQCWTSSRIAPFRYFSRKRRGSSVARSLVSGSSSDTYG